MQTDDGLIPFQERPRLCNPPPSLGLKALKNWRAVGGVGEGFRNFLPKDLVGLDGFVFMRCCSTYIIEAAHGGML